MREVTRRTGKTKTLHVGNAIGYETDGRQNGNETEESNCQVYIRFRSPDGNVSASSSVRLTLVVDRVLADRLMPALGISVLEIHP